MVTNTTTILVVGCGSIGTRHARLLGERDDVEVWLCDVRADNLEGAQQVVPQAKAFDDFDVALQEGPDAVFVCTPDGFHKPMAIAALEAGCDVFCEKPLAENLANAQAIFEATEAAAGMLQVGYVLRYHPAICKIGDLVASGELGNLIGGRALVGSYYTLMCATTPFLLESRDALILSYSHQIDYLRLFFGDVVRVSAESARLGDLEMMPQPNVFSILLTYASGAIAQLHLDFVQYPERHTLEIIGDRKTVAYDAITSQFYTFERASNSYEVEVIDVPRDDVYRTQIAEFLRAVRTDRIPSVSAADGVAAVEVAKAVIESAHEHRGIEI